jgi:hypothetical protein
LPGTAAHLLQAPAYCAQAHSIQTNPRKDQTNDVLLWKAISATDVGKVKTTWK